MTELTEILVLDAASGPELNIVEREGTARAVAWPGVGAHLRAVHRIRLSAHGATVEMRHPSEAVYYVLDGDGAVEDRSDGTRVPLERGSVIHVDADTAYRISAAGGGLDLMGGPAPADPALYEHLTVEA
jgi:mannose-6-phosphate isomerase-like protein (cupin superfamily)